MRLSVAVCVASIVPVLLLVSFSLAPGAGGDINIRSGSPGGAAGDARVFGSQGCETAAVAQAEAVSQVHLRKSDSRVVSIPGSGEGLPAGSEAPKSIPPLQAKPDLTVLDTWTVPGTFCRHAVVDIHSAIKNIGTVTAVDSFYCDIWFDGENIGFARIESLAAGQTLELTLENFAWPGDTVSHIVTAMADTDHDIDEEFEINNIHLEYFAADMCTTCTFVTLPFEAGWNWFSLNVDDPDMSLDHVLASLDTNGVYIKNQTAFAEYVPDWDGWYGTLTSLTCHETYMIKMGDTDTLDFCGFPHDVATPLGLPAGWSWISYLPRSTLRVDNALGSLEASGEYIKNQTAFAEYVPDWNGWFGTLVEMCPCGGYKIRMAAADTLVYPDSVEMTDSKQADQLAAGLVGLASEGWMVDPHDFEGNGCLTAEVRMGGRPCTDPDDRLGAFCGGECKGVASVLVNPDGEGIFYITVYGRRGDGEMLNFRYFESSSGRTYDVREALEFRPDIIEGSSLCPFVLHVSPEPGWEGTKVAGSLLLENRPDPFTRSTTVRFRLGHPGVVDLGVYNVCGEKVATLCDCYLASGTHTLIWHGRTDSGQSAPGGIYFCRLICGDALLTEKMVLMK
jgi:hypothetical protein